MRDGGDFRGAIYTPRLNRGCVVNAGGGLGGRGGGSSVS